MNTIGHRIKNMHFESDTSSDESLRPPPRRRVYQERINIDFENDEHFRQRFRMREPIIDFLEEKLSCRLQNPTSRSCALTVKQKIGIACRLLATGADLRVVADAHGVHKSTSARVLHEFVDAVNTILLPTVVDWPETDMIIKARMFKQQGGKHIILNFVLK